ncbi:MAG: TlpA family protein disulfide reductase [Deltaproteobacteria bacterium]|nr:TlpA family protein disulfide reductase [Deltaproteobacteria bacterium]
MDKSAVRAWVLGLAVAVAGAGSAHAEAVADEGQLKEGQQALMFQSKVINWEAASTKVVDMAALTNGSKKAVILSFFATYCEPCKKELPFLGRMYEKYKDQGLSVVVVSIDQKQEDIQKAGDLAKEHNLLYPVASDRFNIVAKRYGVKRLPCLYILDGAGKVSMVNTGYSEEFSGQLLANIQTRLGVALDPAAVPHEGPKAEPAPEKAAPPADPVPVQDSKDVKKVKGKRKGK